MPIKPPPGLPTAPSGQRVRLPDFPQGLRPVLRPVVASPPPQEPAVMGFAGSYEANTIDMAWPFGREVKVYTTQKRWRACDVYADFTRDFAPAEVIATLCVYAIADGGRTLVATGRVSSLLPDPAPGIALRLASWAVAARSVAAKYEVTARFATNGDPADLATLPGRFRVTVAASDEMTEPRSGVGVVSRLAEEVLFVYGDFAPFLMNEALPYLEVLQVQGINTAAAARYLQLYDTPVTTSSDLVGLTPRFVWPMGALAGAGVVADLSGFRAQSSPVLAVSSAAYEYATVSDGVIGVSVR
jgi:hypothetical protein